MESRADLGGVVMEQWASEWAREMKKGKGVDTSPIIGRVTRIIPLEISIYSGEVILYPSHLYITNTIQMYIEAKTIGIHDRVMVAPTDGQKYFVIDKVV